MVIEQKISSIIDVASDMNQLSQDTLKSLNISYFSYTKVNQNGTFSTLTSDPVWTENFYIKKYYNIGVDSLLPRKNAFPNDQMILWEISERDENHDIILTDLRSHHIHNLCTFIKMTEKETQLYHFGSDNSQLSQNHIYFDHQEMLRLFTYYFQEHVHKSKKLYTAIHADFKFDCDMVESNLPEIVVNLDEPQDFLDIDRYYLDDESYVTKREIECIKWIALGKDLEEVGSIMNISSRTAEGHVNNLKKKLRCHKVISAVYLLRKRGLIA